MASKRAKVMLAVLGSVLLHGIVLVAIALTMALKPPVRAPDPPTPEDPLTLEMIREELPPTPPPVMADAPTPTPTPRQFVDLNGAANPEDSPPEDATFQSDRASRASNAGPATGDGAAPTQEGSRMASFAFDTTPPRPGLQTESAPPAPAPETAPSLPRPDRAAPTPDATPGATPPPAPAPVATAAPDEFAMIMATPTPPEDPFDPSFRSTAPPLPKPAARTNASRSTPPPSAPLRSASTGSITNRGAGGVDAVATPMGRYTKSVTDNIKFLWNRSVEAGGDSLANGSVVVGFAVNRDGRVLAPRVLSNSADAALASISVEAVRRARLPPIPPDVLEDVGGDQLTIKISFDLLPP